MGNIPQYNTITTNQAYESSSSSSSSSTLVVPPPKKEKAKADLSSSLSAFVPRLCRKVSPKMKMKMKNNTVEVEVGKPSDLSSSSVHSNSDNVAPKSISISSTEQLQRVFRYFDENGDGKVSPAELMSCVRTVGGNEHELSLEEAEWAVSTWDMDGDGLLTYHEFERMILLTEEETTTSQQDDQQQKTNSELREAFHMYEMEGSGGCITPTSLKRMLSRLGQSRSLEDCKSIIRFFDLNGDGVLCFHEFAAMMR